MSIKQVILSLDADARTKYHVARAMQNAAGRIVEEGYDFALETWDAEAGKGIDDVLASGFTPDVKEGADAFMLLTDIVIEGSRTAPRPEPKAPETDSPYLETPDGITWNKPVRDGTLPTRLTNFTARILSDVTEDDGVERRIQFEVEATLRGRPVRFQVPAGNFNSLNWAAEHLGASAIVFPGISNKDHARAAIQILSGDVPRRTVYTHLGWREVNGERVYLHAGGAIGATGEQSGIAVRLSPDLNRYVLPAPPEGQEQVKAIRASLRMLDVAPDSITVPLLSATYRAPLGNTGFSIYESGKTGQGKTALAALAQQHYGAEMDAEHLPSAWSSTGNSLEAIAFQAKDALLVVDDFAPSGDKYPTDRLQREAERFLRAQRNRSGRQRMRPDGTVIPAKPPRGLALSTGEDIPRGQSLRAGMIVVELGEGSVDWTRLSEAQRDAASGLYASAMSGYIQWLAPRYQSVQQGLSEEIAKLRDEVEANGQHRRMPQNVANLALGIRYFLKYAQDADAISERDAAELWTRCWQVLKESGAAQVQHDQDSDPVYRFLDLLQAAISSGEVMSQTPKATLL